MQVNNPDDLRMNSLIYEGLSGQISLIGFPHDIGAKRDKVISGQENGPDCIRRFYSKSGPLKNSEYNIDISTIKISDYGNIYIQGKEENSTLEELLDKLSLKVKSSFNKGNRPFVLGGSKDCSFAAIREFINFFPNPAVISMIPKQDVCNLFENDKISMNCGMRKLFKDFTPLIKQKQVQVKYFATQNLYAIKDEQEFLEQNSPSISTTTLEEIRNSKVDIVKDLDSPNTQSGLFFQKQLQQFKDKQIHLSISLEDINNLYFPGVSRKYNDKQGLSSEEIIEIMYLAGQCPQIKSIDLTDFNPSYEDYRSGLLACNIIYYYSMGVAKQLQTVQK